MERSFSRRELAGKAIGLPASLLAALAVGSSAAIAAPSGQGDGAGDGVIEAGGFTLLPYRQYASGGIGTDLYAVILFENKNATFTRYQVAYTSCTCRDAASNYRSVMYVELLNGKETTDEIKIRSISFSQNKNANVGLWGDSNPVHGQPDYDEEYMNEHLVQRFVGATKAQVDMWEGYGDFVEVLDVDAVTGATVSVSNLTSVLRSLFAYHAAKYYA